MAMRAFAWNVQGDDVTAIMTGPYRVTADMDGLTRTWSPRSRPASCSR